MPKKTRKQKQRADFRYAYTPAAPSVPVVSVPTHEYVSIRKDLAKTVVISLVITCAIVGVSTLR